MRTRQCLSGQLHVLEIPDSVSKIRSETGLSLLCSLIPDPSTNPLKQAVGDLPGKTCASRRFAESSIPPVSKPFTRCSIANAASLAASIPKARGKGKGKKRPCPVDDSDESIDPSATTPDARPRKKRRAAHPPRKLKRLPLREELEVLQEALPLVIRSHLEPPRDDKGPIPNERRTFGEFLRWKSLYDDKMVARIVDERHVVCRRCGKFIWLCHDTAYNWFKWGRHRKICIQRKDLPPVPNLSPPVLLHNELKRRTDCPEVDALFPKTKGGPYYRHSWTYFVPRPGQSRPDDPSESLAPSSGILSTSGPSMSSSSSRRASIKSETGPSPHGVRGQLRSQFPRPHRPCPRALDPKFKAEEEAQWSDGNIPDGVELLLAGAKFLERTNVQCTKCAFP
ncbi:hypothetical protein GSI_12576 [Ganoderma sinense ZZ0214-1]|uniref:Uncharacterized protein n=1 Tax=Ganoderma sinense ZZ0214-1 TaxID=1077348 RepID=A0A2G8RT50_9APHY|nr:hypothetical protein GSI_12576 [Ganoderma sinense ZZ0214-1]